MIALPTAVSPASVVPEAIGPLRTPPAARPADPGRDWSGLVVDACLTTGLWDDFRYSA